MLPLPIDIVIVCYYYYAILPLTPLHTLMIYTLARQRRYYADIFRRLIRFFSDALRYYSRHASAAAIVTVIFADIRCCFRC